VGEEKGANSGREKGKGPTAGTSRGGGEGKH
jgi:hypothetical protein